MMKVITFAFFMFLFSSPASALDIKLQCDVNVKFTYSNGDAENSKGSALVEVKEYGANVKFIQITSANEFANNQSVITTIEPSVKFTDNSDENKWDISNDNANDKMSSSRRIVIDRNSGALIVLQTLTNKSNGKTTEIGISGNCNKIKTSVKKF